LNTGARKTGSLAKNGRPGSASEAQLRSIGYDMLDLSWGANAARLKIRKAIERSISGAPRATASAQVVQAMAAADAIPTYYCKLADGAAYIRQGPDGSWQLAAATAE
jgi:hypothetical protein